MAGKRWLSPEPLFVYSDPMSVLFRQISRCLLLIMLATVFSPSFGWEAAQAVAEHEHSAIAVDADDHAAHDVLCVGGGCGEQDATPCADSQHHCCPGHQLGHLPGGVSAAQFLGVPPVLHLIVGDADARFSSRVPEGLERPPRSAA